MDYRQVKKLANEILKNRTAECSYIEYKASEQQLDKILKTICAYGNNYYNTIFNLSLLAWKRRTIKNRKQSQGSQ